MYVYAHKHVQHGGGEREEISESARVCLRAA